MSAKIIATTAVIGGAVGAVAGLLMRSSVPAAPPGPVVGGPPVGLPPLQPRKCPVKGTRVLVIGDSYATGLGPYLAQLAGPCGTPYHYKAIVGSSVLRWQGEDTLREPIEMSDPNVVLVSLGGNDLQNSPLALKKAIYNLVKKLRAIGAKVFWIEPLHIPVRETSGVRQLWKDAVGPGNWFDSPALDAEVQLKRAPDKIHLYPSGYRVWAAAIWPWMAARVT